MLPHSSSGGSESAPQLPRSSPSDFSRLISSLQIGLVLFCRPSLEACTRVEKELVLARNMLSGANSKISFAYVDVSAPGAYTLTDVKIIPSIAIYRKGDATPYHGKRTALEIVRTVQSLEIVPHSTRLTQKAYETLAQQGIAEPVVLTIAPQTLPRQILKHELLFVLFTKALGEGNLDRHIVSNFTYAAEVLRAQRIPIKLGWIRILEDDIDRSKASLARYKVEKLPDLKIFHNSVATQYRASVDSETIIDVARWNVGMWRKPVIGSSSVVIQGSSSMESALSKYRCLLLVFSNLWCSRCISSAPEFEQASMKLASISSNIGVATIDVQDVRNREVLSAYTLSSIPSAKVLVSGHIVGEYRRRFVSSDIVADMKVVCGAEM